MHDVNCSAGTEARLEMVMSNAVVKQWNGSAWVDQDPPLADWFVALSHDSPFERLQTSRAGGGASPSVAAVPNLLSLLKDSDREVRLRVVAALGNVGGEVRRVVPAIRAALMEAALNEQDDAVRAEAVRGLLQAGPQPATEVGALVDALHGDVDVVRFHAAIALGDLGPAGRPALPALIHASLWDDEPAVRVGAAMALWKIDRKGPLVLYVLIKALDNANELICWIAVECLGQIGPAAREAVPALRRALERDFRLSLIKTAVILALERIQPQALIRESGLTTEAPS
jgi:HEAT repeat protein